MSAPRGWRWRAPRRPKPKGLPLGPGAVVTPHKAQVLAQLARAGERGATACYGIMPGGTLGALSMFGLAERAPAIDALGWTRYRITEHGRAVLQQLETLP